MSFSKAIIVIALVGICSAQPFEFFFRLSKTLDLPEVRTTYAPPHPPPPPPRVMTLPTQLYEAPAPPPPPPPPIYEVPLTPTPKYEAPAPPPPEIYEVPVIPITKYEAPPPPPPTPKYTTPAAPTRRYRYRPRSMPNNNDISDRVRNSEVLNIINTKAQRFTSFLNNLLGLFGGFINQKLRDIPEHVETIVESIPTLTPTTRPPTTPRPPRDYVTHRAQPGILIKSFRKTIG